MLGLTAVVVVISQIISSIALFGLLSAVGPTGPGKSATEPSGGDMAAWLIGFSGAAIVTAVGTIVLTGLLTVVVGRAVFGSPISLGEAWAIVRDRFGSLIGLAALMGLAAVVLCGFAVTVIAFAAGAGGTGAAVLIGTAVVPGLIAALAYGYTVLAFAPTIIVLERQPVFEAIRRSFYLVRNSFWRVLGILALTALIVSLISSAVAFPFNILAMVSAHDAGALSGGVELSLLSRIGTTIGEIIVLPFTAGVSVLLYTDRRIRGEAFDLVLRSGAVGGPYVGGWTDHLWLTRPPG
ncbi:hypothetical protein MMIN_13890 [Mycolicibacter minnesotensis]|nr:hypothetical protein MMIN_13890 [Mycolicibacter minnesotensis]